MAYAVDPTDPTHPTDVDSAEQGQAELRALKAYLQGVLPIGVGGLNFFRKNLITNGDCSIDQRREGANSTTLTTGATYIVDHLVGWAPGAGVTIPCKRFTAVAGAQPEFWAGATITTAAAAGAAVKVGFETAIEGQDISFLRWGTVNALPVSLSFLVISPVTGTHCVSLKNSAGTRSYVATFQVPVANIVTSVQLPGIPGCQDGVWTGDNTIGIDIFIDGGSGTNFEAPVANAWQVGNFNRIAGAASAFGTSATVFKITYLQLEQATAVSAFEQVSFKENLSRCQRYFEKSFDVGFAPADTYGSGLHGAIRFNLAINGAGTYAFPLAFKQEKRTNTSNRGIYNPVNANGVPRDIFAAADFQSVSFVTNGTHQATIGGFAAAGSVTGNIGEFQWTADCDLWS